jgi:hypothetical protein
MLDLNSGRIFSNSRKEIVLKEGVFFLSFSSQIVNIRCRFIFKIKLLGVFSRGNIPKKKNLFLSSSAKNLKLEKNSDKYLLCYYKYLLCPCCGAFIKKVDKGFIMI